MRSASESLLAARAKRGGVFSPSTRQSSGCQQAFARRPLVRTALGSRVPLRLAGSSVARGFLGGLRVSLGLAGSSVSCGFLGGSRVPLKLAGSSMAHGFLWGSRVLQWAHRFSLRRHRFL